MLILNGLVALGLNLFRQGTNIGRMDRRNKTGHRGTQSPHSELGYIVPDSLFCFPGRITIFWEDEGSASYVRVRNKDASPNGMLLYPGVVREAGLFRTKDC